MLVDYHTIQCAALDAKESKENVVIHPDVVLGMLEDLAENLRIRDIQRDQLKDANKKLNKIKRIIDAGN